MRPLSILTALALIPGPALAGDLETLASLAESLRPESAPVPPRIDLKVGEAVPPMREQFPASREGQSQGSLGTCHDFATVALFEAAYWRSHGRRHRMLSPTDLFVHVTLASPMAAMDYLTDGVGGPKDSDISEGGSIGRDAEYALKNGIATEASLPYAEFEREYWDDHVPRLKTDLVRADMPLALKAFMRSAPVKIEDRAPVVQKVLLPQLNAIVEEVDREHPAAKESRARSAELFAGFHLSKFGALNARMSREQCQLHGQGALNFLIKNLRRGRPVGIGMDIGGLWDTGRKGMPAGSPTPVLHDFVIVGYEVREGQRVVFKTLNSWGRDKLNKEPEDRFVFDDELCRVTELVAVLAASETE